MAGFAARLVLACLAVLAPAMDQVVCSSVTTPHVHQEVVDRRVAAEERRVAAAEKQDQAFDHRSSKRTYTANRRTTNREKHMAYRARMNRLVNKILEEVRLKRMLIRQRASDAIGRDVPSPIYYVTWSCVSSDRISSDDTTELVLRDTGCTGTIPTELGLLSGLTKLDFDMAADLTGTIPTELGWLTGLTFLGFEDAYGITGSIPTELGLLTQLTKLDIRTDTGTAVTGTIPTELAELTQLVALGLGTAGLTGTIPTELSQLTLLTSLRFDGSNSLSGGIPTEVSALCSGSLTDLRSIANVNVC